jgi:hypothetical protein
MNDEARASEAKVEIRRPTGPDSAHCHDVQSERVGERQILVIEPTQYAGRPGQIPGARRQHTQRAHVVNDREELERARPIKAPQKPGVTFTDDEWGGDEPGRGSKEAAKSKVVRVRPVQKRDQR